MLKFILILWLASIIRIEGNYILVYFIENIKITSEETEFNLFSLT